MIPLLSELWRLVAYLLRPEDSREIAGTNRPPVAGAWRGAAKALLWAGLAVLAGLSLGGLR